MQQKVKVYQKKLEKEIIYISNKKECTNCVNLDKCMNNKTNQRIITRHI